MTSLPRRIACSFSSMGQEDISPFHRFSSGRFANRFASALNESSPEVSRKRGASSVLKRFKSAELLLEIRKISIRWKEKVIMLKEGQVECTTGMIRVQY